VRINRTETQLAALATKRELLRARQLTTAGEVLLARAPSEPSSRAADRKVEEFLTAKPAKTDAGDLPADTNVESTETSVTRQTVRQSQVGPKDKSRHGKANKATRSKPIFQQS
jgi:hypothetical protein